MNISGAENKREFAETAAIIMAGIVAKGLNHKLSLKSRAGHFLA